MIGFCCAGGIDDTHPATVCSNIKVTVAILSDSEHVIRFKTIVMVVYSFNFSISEFHESARPCGKPEVSFSIAMNDTEVFSRHTFGPVINNFLAVSHPMNDSRIRRQPK